MEEIKVDPIENILAQYKQNCYIMVAERKTLDTLTIDLSEERRGQPLKKLVDRYSHETETGYL